MLMLPVDLPVDILCLFLSLPVDVFPCFKLSLLSISLPFSINKDYIMLKFCIKYFSFMSCVRVLCSLQALERNDVIIAIHQSGKASIMKLCLSPTTNGQPPCENKEKKRLHRKGGIRRKDSINKLDSFKVKKKF